MKSDRQNIFNLDGKVAIVTGGIGLLGKHHCEALAEAGASVIVADINKKECERYALELGNNSMGIGIDVTRKSSLESSLKSILEKYSGVDILINNAAINDMYENPYLASHESKFENYPVEMWQKMFDVNVTGTFLCSQVFGSNMVSNGYGSIINISSTYGIVAPDQSIYKSEDGTQTFYKSAGYPATKGAIISFTRFLAAYWGNTGVRVNTLSPGGVENCQDRHFVSAYSSKTPMGRMAAPTDYKGAVIFLASKASSYMTGANLVVDGGWTAI